MGALKDWLFGKPANDPDPAQIDRDVQYVVSQLRMKVIELKQGRHSYLDIVPAVFDVMSVLSVRSIGLQNTHRMFQNLLADADEICTNYSRAIANHPDCFVSSLEVHDSVKTEEI